MNINYHDKPLKIFMAYVFAHKGLFAIDMVCALAVAVIDLVFPYVSRTAMNTLLPQKLFATFFAVMGIMIAAYFLKSVLYYIITVVGHRMGVLTESDMRRDIFTHMQDLSCSFYDKNRTGVLMSRITSDLFEVTELSHHGPENIVICTLTILGALIVLFTLQWQLALPLAVLLPICLWFTLSQRLRMKRANVEVKRKTADIYSAIESSISGIRTAKAFANEHVEHDKFEEANALFRGAKVEYYRSMGLFMSGMEFTTGIMQVVVITVGGLLIMQGKMDFVNLITFSLYVSTFVTPVRKLAQFSEQYMQGAAGFERFLEIMRTEPEIKDRPGAETLGSVEGRIEYRDVSFAYSNGIPVLSHIDLTVEPGQCLAVVGPSGGGKTTLCQLLPRLYDVTGGGVFVDGHDVRDLTQASLRRSIGMLQQDVFMFAGTVRENIRYGRGDATDEEIVAAAVRAEIHDEIMAMPNGYDTYIGERGVMLSGGQKQRVSIARAVLKNAPIYLFDDSFSALDFMTEANLRRALAEKAAGKTQIVVTQRVTSAMNSDKIFVMDGGRLVDAGTHRELLERCSVYREIYLSQTGGDRR